MNSLRINKAQIYSIVIHKNQKYGDLPYSVHLLHTQEVAKRFNLSEDIQIACFLHDAIEDTNTTYDDIKDEFGLNIANLVYAVTDEVGKNRFERKNKTFLKIELFGKDAALLKLSDRIANIENAKYYCNDKILRMYKKEHPIFNRIFKNLSITNLDIYTYYLSLISSV